VWKCELKWSDAEHDLKTNCCKHGAGFWARIKSGNILHNVVRRWHAALVEKQEKPNILFRTRGTCIYTNGSIKDFSPVERAFLSLFWHVHHRRKKHSLIKMKSNDGIGDFLGKTRCRMIHRRHTCCVLTLISADHEDVTCVIHLLNLQQGFCRIVYSVHSDGFAYTTVQKQRELEKHMESIA